VSPSELPDSPRQIVPPYPVSYEKKEAESRREARGKEEENDVVKVFSKGESAAASGMQSVRSLSPLTIDGETIGINVRHSNSKCCVGILFILRSI
jgi:hypothetical protein